MANMAFYHLTRSSAAEALPLLLQKTLAAEKRALVCCDLDQAALFSSALWSFGGGSFGGGASGGGAYGEGSWLPHGVKGKDDADADICPIWFSDAPENNQNNASFMFFINGIAPDHTDGMERVFILFDGNSEAAVTNARQQWKALREDGHDLSYWQQDDAGRWSQSA